jgi:hypothetical protein
MPNLAGHGASSKLASWAHMQLGEYSRRLEKPHRAKEAAGWAEIGPRTAGPAHFEAQSAPPLT